MLSNPLSAIRIFAIAGALTVAGSSSARADDARDQAQQSAAQAQETLDAARANADQAQAAVSPLSAHSDEISSQLDAARQQAGAIHQRMERGQSALVEIDARIESATKTLDARHREMAAADIHYGPVKVADEQARLHAIQGFEESQDYRSAVQAVNNAAAALQVTQAESLRRGHTPESDPNVLISQNRLTAAKASLDALRGNFMTEQLPQIPEVASADLAMKGEEAQYDAISAKATAAEKDLADARAVLERQKAGLAGDQTTLDQLSADMTHLQTDLDSARAVANQAVDDANRALADERSSQQARDNAVAVLQQLDVPQYVGPSTSYLDAPPSVVYGQSGRIYAPGPYYGNIVIVPRGGGYGWNGNHGGYSQGSAYYHDGHGHGSGHR